MFITYQLRSLYLVQRQIIIKPLSTVPFRKDPDFVGRHDIIVELDNKFSLLGLHTRVALVGLGGMG